MRGVRVWRGFAATCAPRPQRPHQLSEGMWAALRISDGRLMAVSELIRLRYPAKCAACGDDLPRGTRARWDKAKKTATCEACVTGVEKPELGVATLPEIDRGQPGASAAREYRRRHDQRQARVRSEHKHLGRLLLAVIPDPQSTTAWDTGYQGESGNGAMLDRLRAEGIAVLHDRRIPGVERTSTTSSSARRACS